MLLIILAIAATAIVWMYFNRAASARPIVELSAQASATMSPNGATCAVDLTLHNDGNVKLTIKFVKFTYNRRTVTQNVNRDLAPGATIGLSYTRMINSLCIAESMSAVFARRRPVFRPLYRFFNLMDLDHVHRALTNLKTLLKQYGLAVRKP